MKIAVIHGQNHKGSTWHAAEELLKNLEAEYECREFFLPRDLDHFCSGCLACVNYSVIESPSMRGLMS